ncbi:MAG: hypothetical protein JJT89_01465 [Nitriliruptoraceae bacterium]|nr:hypothetical protein [Nitriliruptoraceae bacterium]
MLRLAAIQHDIVWEDRDATLTRLEPMVARAAGAGARLIALTEMFATGFSMRVHHTAEPEDGPTLQWMTEQAARHGVFLAGSVALAASAQAAEQRPTNAMFVVGPGGERHRYDKIHPFTYAGEDERFASGTDPLVVTIDGVNVGCTVCYDLRFAYVYWDRPEDVHLELVVANWPEARRHHWRTLLDARAIEGQVYVCGVNRVGMAGDRLPHVGDSRIIDPMGAVLATGAGAETILLADIDPGHVERTRERFPFRADRRR